MGFSVEFLIVFSLYNRPRENTLNPYHTLTTVILPLKWLELGDGE